MISGVVGEVGGLVVGLLLDLFVVGVVGGDGGVGVKGLILLLGGLLDFGGLDLVEGDLAEGDLDLDCGTSGATGFGPDLSDFPLVGGLIGLMGLTLHVVGANDASGA